MMNKDVKGILALVVVTALSFGVIFGTGKLTKDGGEATGENTGTVQAELDVSGAENIEKAVQMDDGSYVVSVKAAGYGGETGSAAAPAYPRAKAESRLAAQRGWGTGRRSLVSSDPED